MEEIKMLDAKTKSIIEREYLLGRLTVRNNKCLPYEYLAIMSGMLPVKHIDYIDGHYDLVI